MAFDLHDARIVDGDFDRPKFKSGNGGGDQAGDLFREHLFRAQGGGMGRQDRCPAFVG